MSRGSTPAAVRRRRGGMYVFVLSTAALVSIMGLGALLTTKTHFAATVSAENALQARWAARTAIRLGLQKVRDIRNWRTNLGESNWFTGKPVGAGRCTLSATRVPDADGNPYNDTWILTGIGRCQKAVHKIQVKLTNGAVPGEWSQTVD